VWYDIAFVDGEGEDVEVSQVAKDNLWDVKNGLPLGVEE